MDIVIFGVAELSSLAWYCLTHDSDHQIVAFTVDRDHLSAPRLHGLPVHAFEDLEQHFSPNDARMLVPIGFSGLNRLRMDRYHQAKERGYRFISYVSSRASIWPDLTVGDNCLISDHASIQPFAEIGDNVVVRTGALVSHHARISDHCFIAAHAVVAGNTSIGERCVVGLNSTVRDGVSVAERCIVAAGAVITKNTDPGGVYLGVPAKRSRVPAEKTL